MNDQIICSIKNVVVVSELHLETIETILFAEKKVKQALIEGNNCFIVVGCPIMTVFQ